MASFLKQGRALKASGQNFTQTFPVHPSAMMFSLEISEPLD